MTRKPGLAALKAQIADEKKPAVLARPVSTNLQLPVSSGREIRGRTYPTYREGKVPIGGYFSPELSIALHQLALDESVAGQPRVRIQALLGEALDLLFKEKGRSPFGER